MDWDVNGKDINSLITQKGSTFHTNWNKTEILLLAGGVAAKAIFTVVMIGWAITLLQNSQPWIFLDYANYLIHEMGHIVFMSFGELWMLLGGTILQITVPVLILIYFIFYKKIFSLAFSLFWIGDVLVNVSVYIGDANERKLPLSPLIGSISAENNSQFHDWYRILSQMNLLQYDKTIEGAVFLLAAICLIGGIIIAFISMGKDIKEMQLLKKSVDRSIIMSR